MAKLSSDNVEKMAITMFRGVLDQLALKTPLYYDIKDGDRGPIWDGNVDFYENDKKRIRCSIDFQVKGRSKGSGSFADSFSFNGIEKWQLENYKIKNGTILIVCMFRKNYTEHELYYASLLPYEIDAILKSQKKQNKPSIKVSRIGDVVSFYRICEKFSYDKRMQEGLSNKYFDNLMLQKEYGKTVVFRSYGENLSDAITNLLDNDTYYYTLDELGRTVNVSRGKMAKIEMLSSVTIKNSIGEVVYSSDSVAVMNSKHEETLNFGNSFSINISKNEFKIRLRGSFRSRLYDLRYLSDVIKTGQICIEDSFLKLSFTSEIKKYFTDALKTYEAIVYALKKHHINIDINIDEWPDDDLRALCKWLESIENERPIQVSGPIFGCIQVNSLKLSTFCTRREDGLYDVKSVWNCKHSNLGNFKCNFNDGANIETSNIYLVLPSIVFQADDINLDDAKNNIKWDKLTSGELCLANLQVLNAIKAYDNNNNYELLQYAEWLTDNLIKYDSKNATIHIINRYQIKKRLNALKDEDYNEIIRIKDKTSVSMAKLCCCLLLDYGIEARRLFDTFSKEQQNSFLAFPISKYLQT